MASEHIPHLVNYSGRLVDIELLQHVARPVDIQRVTVSNLQSGGPKIVTGVEKLAQRYASLLLQMLGDVQFAPAQGTQLMAAVISGTLSSEGHVSSVFALANLRVRQQLSQDDRDVDTYGTIPLDEQLESATLEDINIDYGASTLMLQVALTTAAGSALTYIVPVTAAR